MYRLKEAGYQVGHSRAGMGPDKGKGLYSDWPTWLWTTCNLTALDCFFYQVVRRHPRRFAQFRKSRTLLHGYAEWLEMAMDIDFLNRFFEKPNNIKDF